MLSTRCFDIWRHEEQWPRIITLHKELDKSMEGGVAIGKITEFCGSNGTGKTQLCLQLCINVQFPKEVGGVGGKAIYIDTKQGFHPSRLEEIAKHMQDRFQGTYQKRAAEPPAKRIKFDSDTLLQNVSYVYCANYVQLLATLIQLKQQLQKDSTFKLIIVDSFAFLLRYIEDVSERTSVVLELLTSLLQLAVEYSLAIVITNELTTRISGSVQRYEIVPSLGDSHAHKINKRVLLSKDCTTGYIMAAVGKTVKSAKPAVRVKL